MGYRVLLDRQRDAVPGTAVRTLAGRESLGKPARTRKEIHDGNGHRHEPFAYRQPRNGPGLIREWSASETRRCTYPFAPGRNAR